MSIDECFMQRCFDLAILGKGSVAPNPMVGAVLVFQNKIISEGYHRQFGGAHAEVNVLKEINDPEILKNATLYVNLEPCSHFGKTPPCADLIIAKGIKKVVIACRDSHHQVDGKGIEKLRNNGIEVTVGVLEKQALELNKRFFTFHQKQRPYVILKWAESKDGFLDKIRSDQNTAHVNWITCPETQTLVHLWRSQEQSILVGKNTISNDNASLTVRKLIGKNPIRIVLDSECSLSLNYFIFDNQAPTIIFNKKKNQQIGNLNYVLLDELSPEKILNSLYELQIQSVLIEGGKKTLESFIDANLWDEARIIRGNVIFNEGLIAPIIDKLPTFTKSHFTDTIHFINNT